VVNSEIVIRTASFIFIAPLVGMFVAFVISLWFLFSFRKDIIPRLVSLLFVSGIVFFLFTTIKINRAEIAGLKMTTQNSLVSVTDVPNNSPAQRMGFKKGDTLLSINNIPITGKSELDQEWKKTGSNNNFSYAVLRKGDTLLSINNIPITGKSELDQEWKKTGSNNNFSYAVLRKGDTVNTTTPYVTNYTTRFSEIVFFGENFKWLLLGFILLVMAIFTFWLNTLNAFKSNVWFKRLQLVSSAAFSIGHGGNDAQKVMGIITAALIANGTITSFEQMPTWVPLSCYAAIGLGTMSGGWKIVKTMGTRITKVTPFEGVAAETAGAVTLFVTEALKIPVSTTHTITGAIMGVGATKRLSAVRWGVTINLLWAWILTIPISALLAMGIFFVAKLFF
jgi:phosphate/sulfate permease